MEATQQAQTNMNSQPSAIDNRLYFRTYGRRIYFVSHIQSNPQESPNGFTYHGIITTSGNYPCMYIFIPSNHPIMRVAQATYDYSYIDKCMGLDIPTGAGEVTGNYNFNLPEVDKFLSKEEQGHSVGYDFGHGGDFHYDEYLDGYGMSINGHRWTVEEIEGYLREGFNELIKYEGLDVEKEIENLNSFSSHYDDYDYEGIYEIRDSVIPLNESRLRKLVSESVKWVIAELNCGVHTR